MSPILPYDPGFLPTLPAPAKGDMVTITLPGLPPYKQECASIRNPAHPRYATFTGLRKAATEQMAGRAWYFGPVGMDLIVRAPALPKKLRVIDYAAGIADTVDGSHGVGFTYLPIVLEDDCQICTARLLFEQADSQSYTVGFDFM